MSDPTRPDDSDREHGEGNYRASREYNQRTERFVQSGRVEQAAADAAPDDAEEARELARAEQEGRSRMKEEDPALQPGAIPPDPGQSVRSETDGKPG